MGHRRCRKAGRAGTARPGSRRGEKTAPDDCRLERAIPGEAAKRGTMKRSWPLAVALHVPLRRTLPWVCVGALLAGVAAAQSPSGFKPSEATPAAQQEPITPIPPPPATDPLKLALGERLFTDARLSASGD